MKRPSVFVSSTCYDLKQVRTDIKSFLEGLGLEPILSEFNAFPVSPEIGTLENCLKVVEEKADIFVLIIGARYGSVQEQGKSITNLEFLAGRAKGIPRYIFVMRSVLDVLPVWHKNPEADFTNVVDSPKLFEFVNGIRQSGENWVFPFDCAQDIFEALRTQFAYLFMDALTLRLQTHISGGLPASLLELQGPALRYVIERPKGWEYLLLGQILQDELDALAGLRRDWQYGIAMGVGRAMKAREFINWLGEKLPEAMRIISNLELLFETALPSALGPPGISGNPQEILYAAGRVVALYRDALEWKLDFKKISVDEELLTLRSLASNICDPFVAEIEKWIPHYNEEVKKAISSVRAGAPPLTVELILRIGSPDLAEFSPEMLRVTNLIVSGKLS